MKTKRIVFVVPALEVDATYDPPRRAPFIGSWALVSRLRELGYEAHYIDESFRGDSWNRRQLYRRTLRGDEVQETPLPVTWDEYQKAKMADFWQLSPAEFTARYSAFKDDGSVERTMAHIGLPEEETIEYLAELKPDVVGIPLVATANYLPATRLGKMIKQRFPRVRILFGGQHVTADPEGFLRANPWVDYVAREDAILTIQNMVEGRELMKVVPGQYEDAEHFPLLDCRVIEEAGYVPPPTHTYLTGLRPIEWMASRGCYRNCDFCLAGDADHRVSCRRQDQVRAQLEHFAASRYQEIVFQDDAWLYRAVERFPFMFGMMKELGLSFQNNGGVEFESLGDRVTDLIVGYNDGRPGRCTSLYVPFNPRQWNAHLTAAEAMIEKYETSLANLKRLRESGIFVFTSLIVGTPQQTKRSFEADLRALRRLIVEGYLDMVLPLSATMLPGTQWHRQNGHNIIHPQDWPGFSLFTTHHRTTYMSPRDIEERMVRAIKELADVQKAWSWGTAFPAGS